MLNASQLEELVNDDYTTIKWTTIHGIKGEALRSYFSIV